MEPNSRMESKNPAGKTSKIRQDDERECINGQDSFIHT